MEVNVNAVATNLDNLSLEDLRDVIAIAANRKKIKLLSMQKKDRQLTSDELAEFYNAKIFVDTLLLATNNVLEFNKYINDKTKV
ncbi:MAG: hypothetical protein AAF383_19770 [Cyanobacteria bacterium P01_A01_bin.83]